MNLRRIAAAVLATAAVAAGITTCSAAPSAADIPSRITGPQVDAGWVRAACSVTDDAAKCALRFPEGVRRLEVDYIHSGALLGTLAEWDHDVTPRVRDRIRRMNRRVAPGVRLKCMTVGAIAYCDLKLAARYRDFNVTTFSAGVMLGGLKGEGIEKIDPTVEAEVVEPVLEVATGGEVIDLAPYEEWPTEVTTVTVPVVPWTPGEEPTP